MWFDEGEGSRARDTRFSPYGRTQLILPVEVSIGAESIVLILMGEAIRLSYDNKTFADTFREGRESYSNDDHQWVNWALAPYPHQLHHWPRDQFFLYFSDGSRASKAARFASTQVRLIEIRRPKSLRWWLETRSDNNSDLPHKLVSFLIPNLEMDEWCDDHKLSQSWCWRFARLGVVRCSSIQS